METIVLINPPNPRIVLRDMYSSTISKGNYNWPCTDLLVLSGILKDSYNVQLIDANSLRMSEAQAIDAVLACRPAGVIFSFGNSVREDEYRFIRRLREKLPGVKFAGTGGILYHNSEHELQTHPEFDACLLSFVTDDALKYFRNDLAGLNNMVYRADGVIVRAPSRYPEHGFAYPVPLHDQLPLSKYGISHGRNRPLTSVLTSCGCPGKCNFCVAETIEYRYRSPDNVMEELRAVKKLGIREIFFRDNAFCAQRKPGHSLLRKMIDEKLGFSWVADTRANYLDEETVTLMKRAGCHALHIGVESSNLEILKRYNKHLTLEQVENAFALCKKHGIRTIGYFILGLPGETADDVRKTIDLAIRLDCNYASFNVPLPIIGTSLRKEAMAMRWIDSEHSTQYDGSSAPVMSTPSISAEEISRLRSLAYRKFYLRPGYVLKSLAHCRNWYQIKMLAAEFIGFIRPGKKS